MSNRKALLRLVLSAMFLALTVVFTAFIKIPIGPGGYVHLGDAMICLSAALLPLPYAVVTAGVGGLLSDLAAGYPAWAPYSLVIKALLALCFTGRRGTVLCKRNYAGVGLSVLVTVAGYFAAETVLVGAPGAYASIPWNFFQSAASGLLFVVAGKAMDRADLKKRFLL